jgi:hypothetical protein
VHLLKKGVPFVYDDFSQLSFDALKKELISFPLLSPLDYRIKFMLYLIASKSTIDMVSY